MRENGDTKMSLVKLSYIEEMKNRGKALLGDKTISMTGKKLGETRSETFKERAKSLVSPNYFKTHTFTGKVAVNPEK